MSCVLLWSAISRVAKQHISAWRAVVAVMLLGLTVVAGCDVRPFCTMAGSCSSDETDETDDGGGGDTIELASTPEEIDVAVGDVVNVEVRVVTPVSGQTYSFRISEQPIGSGQIDEASIETDSSAGIMSFRFEATTLTDFTTDTIGINVTDSASEEGSLDISVSVSQDVSP